MKKISGPNVSQPNEFSGKLQQLMGNVFDLFELTKEYEYPTRAENSVGGYSEDNGKYNFQVARQYERPSEFLQVLLDVMRVNYDPRLPGTWFLNSNPSYIYDGIPKSPFCLGYVSLVSNGDEDFSSFYPSTVAPYIEACGYDITQISKSYAVVSSGGKHNFNKLVEDVCEKLESAFSVYVVNNFCAPDEEDKSQNRCYAGFCVDPALENRIRLSMWFYIPEPTNGEEALAVS